MTLNNDPDANDPQMVADLKELSETAEEQIARECPSVGRHTPAFRNLVFIRVCELVTMTLTELAVAAGGSSRGKASAAAIVAAEQH